MSDEEEFQKAMSNHKKVIRRLKIAFVLFNLALIINLIVLAMRWAKHQ